MKEKLNSFINKVKSAFSKDAVKKFFDNKKKRRIFIIACSVAFVILATVIAGAIYLGSYYHADELAIVDFLESELVSASFYFDNDGAIIAKPEEIKAGLIFYPGGKVEYTAYLPLMISLAERGILCVLPPMPCNLAVLDVNAADGIMEDFPQVESWYIGGHSLGGSMAAKYLSKHADEFDGLVLLGSYSVDDVSGSRVISILGTEDEITNMKKYEKYKVNIPIGCEEVLITGGNHAYFGMYGEQKGDGAASITPKEQIIRAAYRIADFILQ